MSKVSGRHNLARVCPAACLFPEEEEALCSKSDSGHPWPLATLPLLFVSDFVLVSRKPRPLPLVTLCLQSGPDEGMLQAAVARLETLQ